jgi:hypothetical protein
MARYRLYYTFRWKAKELGWGNRIHEFDAENNSRAIEVTRIFLQSNTTKISYELEKLTRVQEIIVASKMLFKRLKRR